MAVDVGDTITFRSDLFDKPIDEGGVLVNATTAALTITLPDRTLLTPAPVIVNPPATTGKYFYRYSTTSVIGPGPYDGAWLFTMSTGQTSAYFEHFDVTQPRYIIGLAEAKAHLNITSTANDEELRGWLSAVTEVVESKVGPVVVATVVDEDHDAGPSLWLRQTPVLVPFTGTVVPFLTSGTTYLAADLRVTAGGRLRRKDGLPFTGGPFAVTYKVGRPVVRENISKAAVIILKHCWESQRGASGLPLQGFDDTSVIPGFGFAVPNQALDMLAPDLLSFGFA